MKNFLFLATLLAGASASAQEAVTSETNFNFSEIGAGLTWETDQTTY